MAARWRRSASTTGTGASDRWPGGLPGRVAMLPPMSASPRHEKVDEIMERAEAALRRSQWFEAERLAFRALEMARQQEEFDLLARVCLPLQEARRQRIQEATGSRKLNVLSADIGEEMPLKPGCYLIQPPAVGADARRLRLGALRREIPVAVMCREPRTGLGLCPVVAIGQVTVRTRIDPPKDWDKPDHKWFLGAMEQLGDAAIEMLDTGMELDRQIDFLIAALDAVPDHEKLHQVLASACREAAKGFVRSTQADELDAELAAAEDEPDISELDSPATKRRGKGDDEE